jgi:carboxypeptidase T
MIKGLVLGILGLVLGSSLAWSHGNFDERETLYWMKVKATTWEQRNEIANTGAVIEQVREDYLIVLGTEKELAAIRKMGRLDVSFRWDLGRDFPEKDADFHNYTEVVDKLKSLNAAHSDITELIDIGGTVEDRRVWAVRVSGQLDQQGTLPGIVFMGGHHSREHLSVDTPLRQLERILVEYKQGNERIRNLVNSRDIYFIPAVNPDGLEFDIADGTYKAWRKNRAKNQNGTFGVDLNRNYGFGWGTGGSSTNPSSDTFMGPKPFSEPETQNIKAFIEARPHINIVLSYHTFSELILYPWGGKSTGIDVETDRKVFEAMAQKMAGWNRYKPMQASQLYIASGDTCDWAYGEHKIFCFTFELDPKNAWGTSGFYPGQAVIPGVVAKNYEPILYLADLADNPYRALQKSLSPSMNPSFAQQAPAWTHSSVVK